MPKTVSHMSLQEFRRFPRTQSKSDLAKQGGFRLLARPILRLYDSGSIGIGAEKWTEAFTLIELLIVIAVIAMLMAILVPALRRAREQSLKVVCSNNLKQVGVGLHIYGVENDDRLPPNVGGYWLWDLANSTADFIMKSTGKNKDLFYCPSDYTKDGRNRDVCWEFNGQYHVTGYFWMMDTEPPRTFHPESAQGTPKKDWVKTFTESQPATKDLVTDATISTTTDPPDFVHVKGGLWTMMNLHDRTNHIRTGGKPEGGNVLYLDQHVKWRPFSEMQLRLQGPGLPYHYW